MTVVRPRRSPETAGTAAPVDPGWDLGQIGGHDLALLHALARDDSGEPWEIDVGVAGPERSELRFSALVLGDPLPDEPVVAGPPDPAEYAFS